MITHERAKEAWENTEYGKVRNPSVIDEFFNGKCVWILKKAPKYRGIKSHYSGCKRKMESDPVYHEWKYCHHCGREIEVNE